MFKTISKTNQVKCYNCVEDTFYVYDLEHNVGYSCISCSRIPDIDEPKQDCPGCSREYFYIYSTNKANWNFDHMVCSNCSELLYHNQIDDSTQLKLV